jgi:hypothetical protein
VSNVNEPIIPTSVQSMNTAGGVLVQRKMHEFNEKMPFEFKLTAVLYVTGKGLLVS